MTPAMVAILAGSGAVFWACASVIGAVLLGRFLKPPARETIPPPAPGPKPVPGPTVPPSHTPPGPERQAPAPAGPYGTCVMTSNFYDSGVTVIYDHVRRAREVHWPPVDDEDLRDLLDGEAAP